MSLLDYFRKSKNESLENTIVYIHGAGASPRSFNYIKSHLPDYKCLDISYETVNTLETNINDIRHTLQTTFADRPITIISHSLGGNIAAILQDDLNIEKLVTMSTPFAGSKMLYIASLIYPTTQLFKDAKHTAKYMRMTKNVTLVDNSLCIVTSTGYNPVVGLEPNDGVVTVKSQRSVHPTEFYEVELNHNEVLLSREVANKIKSFIG